MTDFKIDYKPNLISFNGLEVDLLDQVKSNDLLLVKEIIGYYNELDILLKISLNSSYKDTLNISYNDDTLIINNRECFNYESTILTNIINRLYISIDLSLLDIEAIQNLTIKEVDDNHYMLKIVSSNTTTDTKTIYCIVANNLIINNKESN